MKKITIIILIFLSSNLISQENELRYFSLNYFQKLCVKDFSSFTPNQNNLLPILSNNARLHGMDLQGAITDHIIIGLSAIGSLHDNINDNGYTSWGGSLATVSAEYRYHLKNFFISPGVGLGCGRFTYSTAFNDGSYSVTAHVDAIFTEPRFKLGYIVKNKLILNIDLAYIVNISGNDYNVGAEISPNVFPESLIIGASIGYKFPFWSKQKSI